MTFNTISAPSFTPPRLDIETRGLFFNTKVPASHSKQTLLDLTRAAARDVAKYQAWDSRCELCLKRLSDRRGLLLSAHRYHSLRDRVLRMHDMVHNHLAYALRVLKEREGLCSQAGLKKSVWLQAHAQGRREAETYGLPTASKTSLFPQLEAEINREMAQWGA
jgi:hypothetical protein